MANLELVALVVRDYEPAIQFFIDVLQFELVEDTPSLTNDGRPKRWVVVRPTGAQTDILLARADGEHQIILIGRQFAGRVGLFLRRRLRRVLPTNFGWRRSFYLWASRRGLRQSRSVS